MLEIEYWTPSNPLDSGEDRIYVQVETWFSMGMKARKWSGKKIAVTVVCGIQEKVPKEVMVWMSPECLEWVMGRSGSFQ